MSVMVVSLTKPTNKGPRTYYYVQFRKHIGKDETRKDIFDTIHCGPVHKQESWDEAEQLLREHLEEWHNYYHNRLEQLADEIARKKATASFHTMDVNYEARINYKPLEEG